MPRHARLPRRFRPWRVPPRLGVEALEDRRLLANIVWENRIIFDNGHPNDNRFDDVFGGIMTLQAIGVVDAAIDYWERTIESFNYPGGGDYSLNISMNAAAMGSGPGGVGANGGFSESRGGKPSAGWMAIGWRSGITPTATEAAGWYLDPTPMEHGEFQGAFFNGFARAPSAGINSVDLFTVVLHELGHALGLGATTQTLAMATNSNIVDTINTPASNPASTYWRLSGNSQSSLWTSWDSGGAGGNASNAMGPQHFAPLGAQWADQNLSGAVALMNAQVTSRSIISDVEALAAGDAYGYTITLPSRFGTLYNTLDANGRLRINFVSLGLSDDYLQLSVDGTNLVTYFDTGNPVAGLDPVGGVTSYFPLADVTSIDINTGGGNDFIRLEGNGGKPTTVNAGAGSDIIDFSFFARNLGNLSATTAVDGGAGYDQVFAYDNNYGLTSTYSITSARFDRPGWGGFSYAANIESLAMTTGAAADTVNVLSTFVDQPIVLNSAGGEDTVNVGGGPSGVQEIRGNLQIHNDPWFTRLNINDGGNSVPRNAIVDQWAGNFGALAGLAPAYVTWDNADIREIRITTGSGADSLDVLRLSERLFVANSNGVDQVRLGNAASGMHDIQAAVDIGPNEPFVLTDLTVNDAAATQGRSIGMVPDGEGFFVTGMPYAIRLQHVRSLGLQTGSGWDQFTLLGTFKSLWIDGGSGVDSLLIDDRTLPAEMVRSRLFADRLERDTGGFFPVTVTTNFANIESPTIYLDETSHENTIYGTSASIPVGYQMTLHGGPQGDMFTVKPRNDDGSPSILGAMGILGGAGADTLLVDDSASLSGANWSIDNYFGGGTQNFVVAGGLYFGALNDIETMVLQGSQGDDHFAVERYHSGTVLQILAQGGNDVIEVAPTLGDLYQSITLYLAGGGRDYLFDGGDGYDQLYVRNQLGSGYWNYDRTSSFLRLQEAMGNPLTLHTAGLEYLWTHGATQTDVFSVLSIGAETVSAFDGGDGHNEYLVGENHLTEGIAGGLQLFATLGTNTITVDNSADPLARTVHIDWDTVGAAVDDNLFGAGGYLLYSNFLEITVRLGTGDDTIYVVPHPYTAIVIDDAEAPGESADFLGLGFADVSHPVLAPNGPYGGTYTFDDAAAVRFTGLEIRQIDDVAPEVLSVAFEASPQHAVLFHFSEDVSLLLRAEDLWLTYVATGERVDAEAIALSYDSSADLARLTFLGLAGGQLPAGAYAATLSPRVGDVYGNRLRPFQPLEFTVAPPRPDGDFNHDGLYDILDLDALVAAIAMAGQTSLFDLNGDTLVDLRDVDVWLLEAGERNIGPGRAYRSGDANLDGVVDGSDFNIWNGSKFTAVAAWSQGDFNADGVVDGSDFNIWNANKFTFSVLQQRPNGPIRNAREGAVDLRRRANEQVFTAWPGWQGAVISAR